MAKSQNTHPTPSNYLHDAHYRDGKPIFVAMPGPCADCGKSQSDKRTIK